jgi:hypothetical protein
MIHSIYAYSLKLGTWPQTPSLQISMLAAIRRACPLSKDLSTLTALIIILRLNSQTTQSKDARVSLF